MSKDKKSVLIFLVITFALSIVCYYIYIINGEAASGIVALLMWCPGLAAIIIKNIFYRKERLLGFQRCNIKYILLGIFIPAIYLAISYGIYWVLNPESFTGKTLLGSLIYSVITLISGTLLAMGEEIGWRGFLLPKMDQLIGRKPAIIVCGLIWAVWHYPLMIAGLYQSGTPAWYQLPMFTIEIILITAVMAYLRFYSGSLWPAILLHASHNFIDQVICAPLTAADNSAYFAGETGFITILCILLITLWLFRKKHTLVQ
jgi:membrane protease YdiL (CAAX protease family)